jgi:glycosyltransferase involved in cell wall biosynthesis
MPTTFNYLKRLCHVPNELGFAFSVRKKLEKLQIKSPIDFVLCHGYTLTRVVGHYLNDKSGAAYGMFMHGDIFSRPKGTYDSRLTAFYRWMAPRCYRDANVIFALSPEQKALAVNAGARTEKVVVTPNGIESKDIGIPGTSIHSEARGSQVDSILNLLYVGRFSVEKGVEVLLGACGILSEWNVDFSLTLVGDGPEQEKLSDLAKDLGITNRVTFVGSVPRQKLGALYRSSDMLCVPSLDEPLGNVVLEGLIGGCLVLGSDVGGISFILTDGVDGYLVPPARPDKLAEKIRFVSENKAKVEMIRTNALEMVQRRFKWDEIVLRMHEAIDDAMTRH